MTARSRYAAGVTPLPAQAAAKYVTPSWHGLYRAGGLAAALYILVGLIAPAILFIPQQYERGMDGHRLLQFIGEHRTWWIALQTLVVGLPNFFAIVFFVALTVSLLPAGRSLAVTGAAIVLTCFVLFVAYYPVTLGIVYLSDLYADAGPERQASLAGAAEGLIAIIDTFNPAYEGALALGVLCFALAMLRAGSPYPRGFAYLGLATVASVPVAFALWPVVGVGYFWWWLLLAAWLGATGWRLYRLGSTEPLGVDPEGSPR